ncbi:MAG TPA: DUF1294 domain-containing protein [Phycisphaerales bacterium]|nr:DUF1294 domain-containing protein [Phycisphaerales bacterium]HRQ74993.1 DUF1294 domain-containing protein [Phycisphaerales bacterium]
MTPLAWAGACYALMSVVTILAFWHDKRAATRGRARTRESTLHLLELLGGWPGAIVAQRWLRHKNRKTSYNVVLWLIILLHASVCAMMLWMQWR